MTLHELESRFISPERRWFTRNVRKHRVFPRMALRFLWSWIERYQRWRMLQLEVGKFGMFTGFPGILECNVWKTFLILLVEGPVSTLDSPRIWLHAIGRTTGAGWKLRSYSMKHCLLTKRELNRDVLWRFLGHLRSMYIFLFLFTYIWILQGWNLDSLPIKKPDVKAEKCLRSRPQDAKMDPKLYVLQGHDMRALNNHQLIRIIKSLSSLPEVANATSAWSFFKKKLLSF